MSKTVRSGSVASCALLGAVVVLTSSGVIGCGGGSGSAPEGMIIQGTLTEDGGDSHHEVAASNVLRHSAGQRIEEVKICVLGQCSLTDGMGQWGVRAPENFTGGAVEVSVDGHGILGSVIVTVPEGSNEVDIALAHDGSELVVDDLTVDGAEVEHADHGVHE